MKIKCYLLISFLVLTQWAFGQSTITGTVMDEETAQPIPGVNVLIKGTSKGTVTDIDGSFTLEAASDQILIFSFIGYMSQEVPVGNQTTFNISLGQDVETLDEVVVVGYGVQKKKEVTGAITSVGAEDLESLPINNVGQALQGRTSGLTIAANSGQPGSAATIRVRGITSLNNNDPLWVVDGVVVDNGGIGYLNQSDIESIEVLKDAASQAIYGARAAAGVVLVTTKKGKKGGLKVNYSGYYGTSAPARKLDLLNATEYATLRNEASLAAGKGIVYDNPSEFGKGTDWQDAIFNNHAKRQNHEVSLSGGNDVSTFYLSFGYLNQEGIVVSDISEYERYNIRLNSTHNVAKWLKVGQNLGYSREKSIGLGNTNSEFGGPLSSAINLDPLTPVVVKDDSLMNTAPYTNPGVVRDANGYPYGISSEVGQEMTNPVAYMQTRLGNYGWSDNIVGNVFAQAEPIEGLILRSTLGAKLSFWGDESFTPIYFLNSSTNTSQTSFNRGTNRKLDWNLENTVSYSKSINDHKFTVLLGQGAYMDNRSKGVNLTVFNIPVDNFDDASLNFDVPVRSTAPGGYENIPHAVSSIFGRVNYSFKEKYLFTATVRRDGSSRFSDKNKYGYFPSGSIGWVTSEEDFWPENDIVNFLKIRGSYGIVGNDNIGDFAYLLTISPGRNYTFGNSGAYSNGWSPDAPPNRNLKWEETSQANIGFEATVLQDLTVTFDWYKKVTTGILQYPRIPAYYGTVGNTAKNAADMENMGLELELGYRKQLGEFNLSVNGNVSYLKNKVTYLNDGVAYLDGGETFQSSSYPITRTAVGQPVNSFYGFKTLGIFQNQEEIDNYRNEEGKLIQPNAKPGDFKWQDRDGNGEINEKDRDFIGSPIPDWSYGLTLSLEYKNFDFMVFGQGVAGNEIFQGLRRLDIIKANYQTSALGRWTGEGTSNDYPRLVDEDPNRNFTNPSDFYLEKGDYFRIKTMQLGYSLPSALISKAGMTNARVYIMAENLFTFTKYSGYDPEIGGGVMSIDRGVYPQARSFMVGLSVGF
ncbi:SusC/RagA family TonB-linked outer membrane protein [Fulvivirga sediminis]|uniref:TonB-dependent receptor n=1 Tax=Fulvivirga sediminis TaxID=2803949 RepID=A0A937F9B8_9BACT|nr:TonB-dependent receptor [Fulvivirga sediminis]MBL3658701.1 TonB-dependent receptor [Fulvivirga sediminis]